MTNTQAWGEAWPDPPRSEDQQDPSNPFVGERELSRFGRQLDLLFSAPPAAAPEAFAHLLTRIAALMDR
jgi:hypothetical protein